jgi:putative thioredoxin
VSVSASVLRSVENVGNFFDQDVLVRSRRMPVVVEFWAPWCGPSRRLGPVLERLHQESSDAWALTRVNTDHHATLAATWGVSCLPVVKAFRDGKVASELVGSLPESRVRVWIEALLPGGTDSLLQQAVGEEEHGSSKDARLLYEAVLRRSPQNADAQLGLARLDTVDGQFEAALARLDRLCSDEQHRLRSAIARLRFHIHAQQEGGLEAAERRLLNDCDAASRFLMGTALTAEERYDEALAYFLDAIRRDRASFGEPGRRAMLLVFDILGDREPLADRYRSLLAMELYRA